MDRYKFIDADNNIVAVMDETEIKYVTCFTEGGLITFCKDKRFALGVKLNGKIYALNKPFRSFPIVTTKVVDLFEYEKLKSILKETSTFIDQQEELPIEKDVSTIQLYRNKKLKELKDMCKATITSGVTVNISGAEEHFDLSIEDQLNL